MATQALLDIGNVILEPSSTFARLKTRSQAWLPLLVLMALTLGLLYWWIVTLDFGWLREHVAATQALDKPEMRAALDRFLTPKAMLWSSGAGAVLGTLVVTAIAALYYLLAGKAIGAQVGYGKWFAFAVWTSVPRLLSMPLSALQIVTSHGRLAPEDLNMVSLNYLVFHLPASNHWSSLAGSIDLTTFWSIALAVIGFKTWTGRPTGTCVTVALLPYVIVYGLWAVKIAAFG